MMYLAGRVIKTHGIKGEVVVKSESNFLRFRKGSVLYLEDKTKIEIESARPHQEMLLVKFLSACSIDDALKYVGKNLYAMHERRELKAGEYYYEDLIGCACYQKDDLIGVVSDIMEVPQGIVLEINTSAKTILVPYVEEFIKKTDPLKKRIDMELIEGML